MTEAVKIDGIPEHDGVPMVKRHWHTDEYTPAMLRELTKCTRDPIYFLQTYSKVKHPLDGPVPFEMFPYQREMMKHIHDNKDSILLASRQLGKCVHPDTKVTVGVIPKGFKKLILRFASPSEFKQIFGK